MKRVAILDDYQHVALKCADWGKLAEEVELHVFTQPSAGEEELVAALSDFEIVVAMRERTAFPRSLLSKLPKLELLQTTGLLNSAIDVAAAAELGITVCGSDYIVPPAGEHTWALLLACAKGIVRGDRDMRSGGWQNFVARDLAGARIGIIGLGNYGAYVAAIAKAFQMDVVAWSENLTEEKCREHGVTLVSKEDLLATSEFVTIHLRLSDRTLGVIGEPELRAMRSDAYLINTSRGPIVQEDALIQALQEDWIAGAGLDVYDVEPLPADHPLRRMPNAVLSPHLGYVTHREYALFYTDIVDGIHAYLAGAPVRVISD